MSGTIPPLSNALMACTGSNFPYIYLTNIGLEDRKYRERVENNVQCRPLVRLLMVLNLHFAILQFKYLATCLTLAAKFKFNSYLQQVLSGQNAIKVNKQ
jgi:hypothetical protein